jgi:hypothetical protein
MPHPAVNPSSSPSPATCPRCGNRLPVQGDTVGPCPLCRDAPPLAERSTQNSVKALTATDLKVKAFRKRPDANVLLLFLAIVLLSIVAAAIYWIASSR